MGSGFRTFAASEVLTSSNVQNYLMAQSVMYFASTAARDAAITSPVAGMVCFIDSNNSSEGLYVYHGVTGGWKKGPGWNAPWGVMDYKTDTTVRSTTSATTGEIWTGLRTTATYTANRLLRVTFDMALAHATSGGFVVDLVSSPASSPVVQGRIAQTSFSGYTAVSASTIVGSTAGATYGFYWQSITAGQLVTNYNNVTGLFTRICVEDIGPSGAPA